MTPKIKKTVLFLAVIALLALPVLADRTNLRPAWNLFSSQQDIEMGRALAGEADRTLQLVDQHNANTYIAALGMQLAAHAPGERFPYQFKIVNDDAINSFALPGGYIYVTTGLIEAAQNEPQLAGAVAHEIAHVVLRHGTAEVSQAYADDVPNASRRRVSVNDAMSRLNIRFEPDSIVLKHSREDERQADLIATQILYDTGFDPNQMTQFFQKITNDRSNATSDYFNNHPEAANRVARVRSELQKLGELPRNVRGDSPDFHSVKDRLMASNNWSAIDTNRNSMVAYRGRDIEFRYPGNWQVSDRGDSLSIAPDDGFVSGSLAYGMTIAAFQPQNSRNFGRNSFAVPGTRPDNTSLSNATDQLLDDLRQSNPNMRVVRSNERRTVDGAPAMVVELTNDSPLGGTETDWLVTVLRPNGLLRYFVGVAPQREFSKYRPVFEEIVASVQFL